MQILSSADVPSDIDFFPNHTQLKPDSKCSQLDI